MRDKPNLLCRTITHGVCGRFLLACFYGHVATVPGLAQSVQSDLRPGLTVIDPTVTGAGTSVGSVGRPASLLSAPTRPLRELGRTNLRASNVGPIGLVSVDGALRPLANQRAIPVQGAGGRFEETPFSAIGIRAGSFRMFPVLEQSIGFTTNADQTPDGTSSAFSRTDGRVAFQSDWSVHELRGEVGASTTQYLSGDTEGLVAGDARAEFRLDIERGLTARIGLNYELSSESINSESVDVGSGLSVNDQPTTQTYGGFASLERSGGRLNGRLLASVQRSSFGDVDLSDGSNASQDDRDNVEAKALVRLGYELSPAISPFIEASVGTRLYDLEVDADGTRRDAMLYDLRGGAAFDLNEKLKGELALGYGLETYDGSALSDLDGLTLNGSLIWSPMDLTTLTATFDTQLNGATALNDTGSVTYASSLQLDRQIRANLTLNGTIAAAWRDYESGRTDETFQAEAGLTWHLNRSLALIGRVGYENFGSTDADAAYDAATARVGLRLQR